MIQDPFLCFWGHLTTFFGVTMIPQALTDALNILQADQTAVGTTRAQADTDAAAVLAAQKTAADSAASAATALTNRDAQRAHVIDLVNQTFGGQPAQA
jgi:hypothetical protein